MPIFHRDFVRSDEQGRQHVPDPEHLATVGPRLLIKIAISGSLASIYGKQSREIPQPIEGYALFDTGASITSVDEKVLIRLGLAPVGRVNISTASDTRATNIYACAMNFPGNPLPDLELSFVAGAELQNMGYVALIGRDIMRDMVLIYDGPGARVTFAF